MAAGVDETRRTTVTLAISGSVALAALGVLTLLYVNFPPDMAPAYGIHRQSIAFFSLLWGYPRLGLSPTVFQILAVVTLLVFWGAYLFGLWTVSRLPSERDEAGLLPVILGFALAFNLSLLLFFPPILSGDVFHYALQGRSYALYGLNPYAPSPEALTDDPFWALAVWRESATQYGPVWIQLSTLCTTLGGDSVLLTVFLFKLLAGLANVLGAFVVIALTRRLTTSNTVVPLVFYAWNPILLIESAGAAHNDAVMMTLALLSVLLLAQGRLLVGTAVLLASALIKYVTLLLLALALVQVLAQQSSLRRSGLVVRLGFSMALILLLSYAPFLTGLADPAQLFAGVSPSLNPMPNNASSMLHQLATVALQSVGLDPTANVNLALNAVFSLFVLLLLPGLLATKATLADVMGRFGLATLLYSFLIYGGSFPWYLVCPLAALAVAPATTTTLYLRLLAIGLGIGFMLQAAVLLPN